MGEFRADEADWRGITTPFGDAMEVAAEALRRFAKAMAGPHPSGCESISEAIWRVPGLSVTGLCVGQDGRMGCLREAI